MRRPKHPNKEIEAALKYAEDHGWTIEKSSSHAKPWGQMKCPKNNKTCRGGDYCRVSIWSTPKNPQNHAKQLKRVVDKCEFLDDNEEDE